jgi:glyoxylase-like metal-dependent hydrolase (beta-lactamase superfamily II)
VEPAHPAGFRVFGKDGRVGVQTTEPTEVASGVWRLGTELVNWYLLDDGGRLTVVDAGAPKYRPQLDAALERFGRNLDDVAAIVLTHAHSDHTGFAEDLRKETGIPVYVHEGDEQLARTGKPPAKNETPMVSYLRHRYVYRLMGHLMAAGAFKPRKIRELTTFADGQTLDVPGRPRVIHTPGHTAGHCAFQLEQARALIAGDALCTLNPVTGARGPQLMPFALSNGKALDSLTRIQDVDADVVVFGHGEPWREGVGAAVERARAA